MKDRLHWSAFNHTITSSEVNIDTIMDSLKDCKDDEVFDLRPYMIAEPVKLDMYSHLSDALRLFRLHHMRQLLVVSPLDGSLVGMISRKDLIAFMNY